MWFKGYAIIPCQQKLLSPNLATRCLVPIQFRLILRIECHHHCKIKLLKSNDLIFFRNSYVHQILSAIGNTHQLSSDQFEWFEWYWPHHCHKIIIWHLENSIFMNIYSSISTSTKNCCQQTWEAGGFKGANWVQTDLQFFWLTSTFGKCRCDCRREKQNYCFTSALFLPTWFFLPFQKFKNIKIKLEKNPYTQASTCLLHISRNFKDIFKCIFIFSKL